jgi:hypothetical protein
MSCGGKMRLLAVVLVRAVIHKFLSHLGVPSEPPHAMNTKSAPTRRRCSSVT